MALAWEGARLTHMAGVEWMRSRGGNRTESCRAAVPNLFGIRDQFPGSQFSHRPGKWGWFQHYIYCELYFYYYHTSSTWDHQALDPGRWGTSVVKLSVLMLGEMGPASWKVGPTRSDGLGHGRNRGINDESSVFWLERLEVSLSKRRKSLGAGRQVSQRPWEAVLMANSRSSGLSPRPRCLLNVPKEILVPLNGEVLEVHWKFLGYKRKIFC